MSDKPAASSAPAPVSSAAFAAPVAAAEAAAPAASASALDIAASPQPHPAFDQFVATIAALRAPDGCPWDRVQTHESIARNMLEEAYEAVDAIEQRDTAHLREELGDVLLEVVLQSQIAADAGEFTIDEVCADIDAKIVRRHPHVFGQAAAEDSADVQELWDQVKQAEKAAADEAAARADRPPASLLDSVPKGFPSLLQAQKVSKKAAKAGFEWDTIDDVWDKVAEEKAELLEAYAAAPKRADGKVDEDADPAAAAEVEMELGDMLFSLVNVGRRMGVDAESALRASTNKFRDRWAAMEAQAAAQGRALDGLSAAELEELWRAAKAQTRDA